MKKILVIGCGNMGAAMISGWLENQLNLPKLSSDTLQITVIDPNQIRATIANHERVIHYFNGDEIPQDAVFDIIMVAIKPQYADEILPKYARFAQNPNLLIISVVAGKDIGFYEKIFGQDIAIVRVMPNTPALINLGMMGIYGNDHGKKSYNFIQALMQNLGKIIFVDSEDKIDAITALSGSGPAYIFALAEAMIEAGIAIGLTPDESLIAVEQTILGAGSLLYENPLGATKLREMVTSPRGTTQAALEIIKEESTGLNQLMRRAITQAYIRAQILGGKIKDEQNG